MNLKNLHYLAKTMMYPLEKSKQLTSRSNLFGKFDEELKDSSRESVIGKSAKLKSSP